MALPSPKPLSAHNTGASTPSQYSSTTDSIWTTQAYSSSGTSYPVSDISNESGGGLIWKYRQPIYSSHSSSASKMAKIKSSPSHGALAAARTASSHGKLHKRGGSASSVQSPLAVNAPTFETQYPSTFVLKGSTTPPTSFGDIHNPSSPASKTKTKIKPLLRKITTQEKNSLDLSRTAAENEGLGIYTSSDLGRSRPSGDTPFTAVGTSAYHNRTTSGASGYSSTTTSSYHRPGAPYVHPMRQTPRPYTPPLSQSYQNSVLDSEYSGEATGFTLEEENHLRQIVRDASHRPAVVNKPQPALPPLHIHTGSSTILAGSLQSNLAGTPPSSLRRPRANTTSPVDTMSPISRSSIEMAFRLRSRADTDPVARAASIQAARQAFSEKEAAKARKAEKEELRTLERENRKREKQEESRLRKAQAKARSGLKPSVSNEKQPAIRSTLYSEVPPASNLPTGATSLGGHGRVRRSNTNPSVTSTAKGRWLQFLTWLRTKLFKLGKKMSSTT